MMKTWKKSGRYIAHMLAVLMIMTAFTAAYGGAALRNAYADEEETWAVDIYADKGDEERTDNGDIVAPDCGARIWTKKGYNASYTLNGNLTAENRGINPSAEGGGKLTATVNGDLTAKNQDAVYATARKASTSELTFGNVKGGYTGISAGAEDGSNITLKAGSVTAGGVDDPNHSTRAVALDAEGDGSLVSAEIGDVVSDRFGLDLSASDGGEVQLTAGDVTSASTGLSTDLDSSHWAPGGSSYITTGTISSINGYGISCMSMSGSPVSNVMNVKGNVSGSAYGAFLIGSGKSNTSLSVYGDVISTKDPDPEGENSYAGILYNNDSDVLVTGTVSGKDNSLIVNSRTPEITVWKLEAGSGELIKSSVSGIKESIKYIVKTEQPYEEQGSINVTNPDGSALDDSHGYDVAHQGDELVVSVDLNEGSVLKAVYNGEEELEADAQGKYHVAVPEGGGISISADIEGNDPPQHVHSLVKTPKKEATCKEEGCEEYWKCSDPSCGKIFSDENAENETTLEELIIEKTDHSWDKGKITKIATLLRKGQKTYTCTVCGDTKTETFTFTESVQELRHRIEEWIWNIFHRDDPDDGGTDVLWEEYIYVLGHQVNSTNCDDVLGDGTVSYDEETNTLKLSNALMDLAKYEDPVSDSNIVAGIYVWDTDALRIELEGSNRIYSSTGKYGEGKEFVFGLYMEGPTVMTGSGSLEVNLNNDASDNIGIYGAESSMKLTVDGCMLDVMLSGSGTNTGLELWTPPAFKNGALVTVVAEGQNSKAVTGTTSIGNTEISDDSVLEMISEGCAFNCYRASDALKAMGALVNTKATAEGASAWNKTTYLGTFKYVRFPGDSRSGGTIDPQPAPAPSEIVDLPKVKMLKPKASKKAITVKWKKVSSSNKKKITGIEIEYRAKGVSKIKTAGKKATSKKIKGLKSKRKYSVRIRSYKYVNNVKHVSKWSAWKSVKAK